jgi:hypothetical protein
MAKKRKGFEQLGVAFGEDPRFFIDGIKLVPGSEKLAKRHNHWPGSFTLNRRTRSLGRTARASIAGSHANALNWPGRNPMKN